MSTHLQIIWEERASQIFDICEHGWTEMMASNILKDCGNDQNESYLKAASLFASSSFFKLSQIV